MILIQQHGEIYLKDVRVLIGMQIGCKGLQFYLNDVVAIGTDALRIEAVMVVGDEDAHGAEQAVVVVHALPTARAKKLDYWKTIEENIVKFAKIIQSPDYASPVLKHLPQLDGEFDE